MSKYSMHLLVCGGTGCRASTSDAIVENLRNELEAQGLTETVQVIMTGCFGFCENGPIVNVLPDNTFYVGENLTMPGLLLKNMLSKEKW
jgi:NADP-reducing hydrogenase subunit HndC